VLDIGAGRGAILCEAAERVGTDGRVTGIDIAPGMVDETAAEIARRGLRHAEMRLMDAGALLDLAEATFDHVLCGFAVFFFEDLSGVLREVLRVLKPGGRLGFAFSRQPDPRWTWYEALLASSGALKDLPRSPGSGHIRAAGALASAMRHAGFYDVEEMVEVVYVLGTRP
jgi:ubiquinone/menaquinone biosynthesis C-methylase UbiE